MKNKSNELSQKELNNKLRKYMLDNHEYGRPSDDVISVIKEGADPELALKLLIDFNYSYKHKHHYGDFYMDPILNFILEMRTETGQKIVSQRSINNFLLKAYSSSNFYIATKLIKAGANGESLEHVLTDAINHKHDDIFTLILKNHKDNIETISPNTLETIFKKMYSEFSGLFSGLFLDEYGIRDAYDVIKTFMDYDAVNRKRVFKDLTLTISKSMLHNSNLRYGKDLQMLMTSILDYYLDSSNKEKISLHEDDLNDALKNLVYCTNMQYIYDKDYVHNYWYKECTQLILQLVKAGANPAVLIKMDHPLIRRLNGMHNPNPERKFLIKYGVKYTGVGSYYNTLEIEAKEFLEDMKKSLYNEKISEEDKICIEKFILNKAIDFGYNELAKEILHREGNNIEPVEYLMTSVSAGNKEILELLIKRGLFVNLDENIYKEALLEACKKGDNEIIKILINAHLFYETNDRNILDNNDILNILSTNKKINSENSHALMKLYSINENAIDVLLKTEELVAEYLKLKVKDNESMWRLKSTLLSLQIEKGAPIILSDNIKKVISNAGAEDKIKLLSMFSSFIPFKVMNEEFNQDKSWKDFLNFRSEVERKFVHLADHCSKGATNQEEEIADVADTISNSAKKHGIYYFTKEEIHELFDGIIKNNTKIEKMLRDNPSWLDSFLDAVERVINSIFNSKIFQEKEIFINNNTSHTKYIKEIDKIFKTIMGVSCDGENFSDMQIKIIQEFAKLDKKCKNKDGDNWNKEVIKTSKIVSEIMKNNNVSTTTDITDFITNIKNDLHYFSSFVDKSDVRRKFYETKEPTITTIVFKEAEEVANKKRTEEIIKHHIVPSAPPHTIRTEESVLDNVAIEKGKKFTESLLSKRDQRNDREITQ